MLNNIETIIDSLLISYDNAIKQGDLNKAENVLKEIEQELSKLNANEIKLTTKEQLH